jgi:hypothetical protein
MLSAVKENILGHPDLCLLRRDRQMVAANRGFEAVHHRRCGTNIVRCSPTYLPIHLWFGTSAKDVLSKFSDLSDRRDVQLQAGPREPHCRCQAQNPRFSYSQRHFRARALDAAPKAAHMTGASKPALDRERCIAPVRFDDIGCALPSTVGIQLNHE